MNHNSNVFIVIFSSMSESDEKTDDFNIKSRWFHYFIRLPETFRRAFLWMNKSIEFCQSKICSFKCTYSTLGNSIKTIKQRIPYEIGTYYNVYVGLCRVHTVHIQSTQFNMMCDYTINCLNIFRSKNQ